MTCILVIEDDLYIRDNIAESLEYAGYSTLKAENGSVGVESALRFLPDLIICDVMMPEMDGYGVLSALRRQPTTSSIPFVFLTAKSDWMAVRYGMDLGADDYLVKPHTIHELLTAVTTQLGKRSLIDRTHQQSFDELRINLLSMLPHELRTPLFGILGNAQLICSDYETMDEADIQQIAEGIVAAGMRLQHVIENYFVYAQIELASYDTVQIAAAAEQRVAIPGVFIREAANTKASRCERINDLSIQAEDVVICISMESLWKIVDELVDNALKFSQSGTPIEITGLRDRGVYSLCISDQGRGMMSEQIKQVGLYMQFERQQYEQQGVGLGLILAKRLAQLYAGNLNIVSEIGHGTTVSVEIPLAI